MSEVATNLVPYEGALVDPTTGELIELHEAADERIAEILERIKELVEQLRLAKGEVDGEVLRRMDSRALWTLSVGDVKLTSSSPGAVDYDEKLLQAELNGLVEQGRIDKEAMERAFTTKTVTSVSVRGVNALLKLGGEVKETIERCQKPKRRYVTLKDAE